MTKAEIRAAPIGAMLIVPDALSVWVRRTVWDEWDHLCTRSFIRDQEQEPSRVMPLHCDWWERTVLLTDAQSAAITAMLGHNLPIERLRPVLERIAAEVTSS